jgi:YbbR domain-containing protein
MKRKLTNNISLKIMSVIVGILVWLIVVNVDNPTISKSITVTNVEIINKDYIEDVTSKMVLQSEGQSSIRVTITGERKTLSRIDADNITVIADMQQAVNFESNPVMVPITATCSGIKAENIKVWPQNLGVRLEDKLTQEFPVTVTKGESSPARGYEVGTLSSSPEKVRITGPQSLINKIDKVTASIGVDGRSEDRTEEVNLIVYDKNQEVLDDSQMANLKIENNGKVLVTCKLWKIRTDIKINAEYSGVPAEGYQVDSITTIPDTISLAGDSEALETLRENNNTLLISADSIDISGESSDIETKINITDILPEGTKLPTDSSEDVWVRISILPIESHAYSFETKNIEVENRPQDLQVAFETDKIEIRIKATDGEIEDFDESKIRASVDLQGKEEGNHEIPVKIQLPEGYELLENVTTEVKISQVSSATDNN